MILEMVRLRVLGPRARLPEVIRVVQDVGVLHLAPPPERPQLEGFLMSPADARRRRAIARAIDEVEGALAGLGAGTARAAAPPAGVADFARWTRVAHRVRRRVGALAGRAAALEEERALLARYRDFFEAFEALLRSRGGTAAATVFHVVLRADQADQRPKLEAGLRQLVGPAFESVARRLPSGETAM
ncbi:MAG TPA: hypothetical protein VFU46_02905, partial [Gemmatimonadales bacterium]|nr:hypothetical protein [Gemmatimonadales bacterium]